MMEEEDEKYYRGLIALPETFWKTDQRSKIAKEKNVSEWISLLWVYLGKEGSPLDN